MKRLFCLLSAAVVLLSILCGCALFDKEYRIVKEYEAQTADTSAAEEGSDIISDYAALRRAITSMVQEHAESAELQFQNYDGTVSQDLSTACWEVKSSTALGAFAVDYISYDLSRIVSYYQAEIHITYKRSEYQVNSLEKASTVSALSARLTSALQNAETYLVLETSAASVTEETLRDYITSVYYTDPLTCPMLPEVEVSTFPENGVTRIFEITLTYPLSSAELSSSREALGLSVDIMADAVRSALPADAETADIAYALCLYLTENCTLDPEAGATAWDALCNGTANSEGLAMALEAGCQALDISCEIVSGRLDGEDHLWNILTLDGISYHTDISNWASGEENVFLVGDERLWGAYWWDTSNYPACPEDYGYFDGPEITSVSAELGAVGIEF